MNNLKKQAPFKKNNGLILLGGDFMWIDRLQELKKQEEQQKQLKKDSKVQIGNDSDWISRYLALKNAEENNNDSNITPTIENAFPWAVRPVTLQETDLTQAKVIVVSTKSEAE